ncbi:Photosystem I assembly protein Ycf3 [Rubripirellula amarantea]|uniref:Photosystem I assembly protein Ycf3 n=1 Tax=Rubripirellula amarantea TaxID=2527999 RepID=A0A5C5WXF6_9BACT|nr:hypothetical protein [Rubripirellula amarantea]TWT54683.1 Photosystem I assembly protein Ycf3 [Rubripirellula amarantea]
MSKTANDRKRFVLDRQPSAAQQAQLLLEAKTKLAQKELQRRQHWQINTKLAGISVVALAIIFTASAISYYHHSTTAATTFLSRAKMAADVEDHEAQAKWLSRYSLLRPDDLQVVIDTAIAADTAANLAEPERYTMALHAARKQLGIAIARISAKRPDDAKTLRKLLIQRLLQAGGPWLREAERQVVLLDADAEDAEATKSLAVSLMGQAKAAGFTETNRPEVDIAEGYWRWLASQPIGEVLATAVDRNPGDTDLIANLLSVFPKQSDLFDAANLEEHQQRLQVALKTLTQNHDSRSKLILFDFYQNNGKSDEANQWLIQNADVALQRLQSISESEDQTEDQPLGGKLPDHYWDFVLIQEAAPILATSDATKARQWYQTLMSLQIPSIPDAVRENVFANAGLLANASGAPDDAIAIWESGLEQVDANSLDLLGLLANAKNQGESDQEFSDVLDRFRDALETYSLRLSRTSDNEISHAARTALSGKIQVAKWRLQVLEGSLDAKNGQSADAAVHLEAALSASIVVDARERAAVALQLAAIYADEGIWDQVASSYDRAVDLVPNDLELRIKAADAWMQSGNRMQAMEHWRVLGASDSPAIQAASIEALFNYQLRLPHEQRDFSGVRTAVARIKRSFAPSQESDDPKTIAAMAAANSRLAVVEASLPPSGTIAEDHLRSQDFAEKIHELAVRYEDDGTIQAFAAERLAALGHDEQSKERLAQLEKLVGKDDVSLVAVRARIEAERGNIADAGKQLLNRAEADPVHADELRFRAFEIAARGRDSNLAYEALSSISDANKTHSLLFQLAKTAIALPHDSQHLKVDGKTLTPSELASQWQQTLRTEEGETGSYWKFLRVSELIVELRSSKGPIEPTDPRLVEARSLVRELVSLRPRWGEAISLEGWIASIEGNAKQAISKLRRGIAAGDRRLMTRQCLIEQLCRVGLDADAERELHLASMSTDIPLDQYATTKIQLAQRQGEFERSVDVAQDAIDQRPTDFICHVVMCKAASIAAVNTTDSDQQERLIEKARSAIQKAAELATKPELAVFAAHLELELAHGDEASARGVIADIDNSELAEHVQLVLQSHGLTALKDYQAALPLLQAADKLKPTATTQRALAELYRLLHRQDEAVNALRLAQSRDSNNTEIRNDLARALAARDGEDVDWNELEQLLAKSDKTSVSNRYLHAVLLGLKGNSEQQTEAFKILRALVRERNSSSDDAARFLAALLGKQLKQLGDSADEKQRDSITSEIRSTHESLVRRTLPEVGDLYRFADFLLDSENDEDLPRVKNLLDELQSTRRGTVAALEIGVRYAQRTGDQAKTPEIVNSWANDAVASESMDDPMVAGIAGSSLIKLGFIEEGLNWHKQSYEKDPKRLPHYVVALSAVGKTHESVEVCTEHYLEHEDLTSAVLLAEALMNSMADAQTEPCQQVIESALDRFSNDAGLIEAVATLRLQQGNNREAVQYYERALKIDPLRLRSLNNLAMALSEMPDRAHEGVNWIDRAIQLAGEAPELLDTKGVVLLKAGHPVEAQQVFQQAVLDTNEPRYQFHLIVALLQQDKEQEAAKAWKRLDIEKLDRSGLTVEERDQLDLMAKKYSS